MSETKSLFRVRAKDPDHYKDQTPKVKLVVANDAEDAIDKFKRGVQYGHSLTIQRVVYIGEVLV